MQHARPRSTGKPLPVATAAARGVRFPLSRRYLWDRTPAGPQVLVSVQVRQHGRSTPWKPGVGCARQPARHSSSAQRARRPPPKSRTTHNQDLLPRLSIAASALASVADGAAAYAAVGDGSVPLRLTFAATNTYQLTGLLQGADPLAGPAPLGAATVPVQLSAEEPGGAGDTAGREALLAALAARLDAPCSARIGDVRFTGT